MNRILLLVPVLVLGTSLAYAQPLEDVRTRVLDSDGESATVQIQWNGDSSVRQYEVGCVSCTPNIIKSTAQDSVTVAGVTAFSGNSIAMLYVIAYDSDGEIANARQILVDIGR